jgi:hypothetical protein
MMEQKMNIDDEMQRMKGKIITLTPGWEISILAHSRYENMEGFGKAVIHNVQGLAKSAKENGRPLTALHLVSILSQMLSQMVDETTKNIHTKDELMHTIILCPYYIGDMLMDNPSTKNEAINLYLELVYQLTGSRVERTKLHGL